MFWLFALNFPRVPKYPSEVLEHSKRTGAGRALCPPRAQGQGEYHLCVPAHAESDSRWPTDPVRKGTAEGAEPTCPLTDQEVFGTNQEMDAEWPLATKS